MYSRISTITCGDAYNIFYQQNGEKPINQQINGFLKCSRLLSTRMVEDNMGGNDDLSSKRQIGHRREAPAGEVGHQAEALVHAI